jgi:hypothetical protein
MAKDAALGSAGHTDFADLLPRLRTMAQGRETLDVAQLHFVGLNEIEQAYGDRWPEQKAKIQDAAETFLRRRIDGGDVLIRGDGGFLVVLSGAAGPEAHAISAQLTHGLNAFFLGEGSSTPAPRFVGAMQTMAVRDLVSSFGSADFETPVAKTNFANKFGLPDLDWKFKPVWDVRRQTLSYWYVTPFLKSSGVRLPGYQFESVAAPPSQFVKIDEASLWIAEQTLQDLTAAGKSMLVGATVHVATLANLSSRARILATVARLDPNLHRFRIIKVAGLAPGFPRMYLNEIVGVLKAHLPNIVLAAAWDEPDVAGLLRSGPIAVGCAVPASAVGAGSVIGTNTLMARISEAVRTAHGGRIRFFIEGAISKYLALKVVAAGVDNIASQSIWPACRVVEGMLKWPADNLVEAKSYGGLDAA